MENVYASVSDIFLNLSAIEPALFISFPNKLNAPATNLPVCSIPVNVPSANSTTAVNPSIVCFAFNPEVANVYIAVAISFNFNVLVLDTSMALCVNRLNSSIEAPVANVTVATLPIVFINSLLLVVMSLMILVTDCIAILNAPHNGTTINTLFIALPNCAIKPELVFTWSPNFDAAVLVETSPFFIVDVAVTTAPLLVVKSCDIFLTLCPVSLVYVDNRVFFAPPTILPRDLPNLSVAFSAACKLALYSFMPVTRTSVSISLLESVSPIFITFTYLVYNKLLESQVPAFW